MKRQLLLLAITAIAVMGCKKETVPVLPTVKTVSAVTEITKTEATAGGEVVADGGAEITARGVCWATSLEPTVSGNKTVDGEGLGSFTSKITGLNPGEQYYVRAYATNSAGTAYGNVIKFTTQVGEIKLSTAEVTEITENQAKSGGNIADDGGLEITARGVCWGTEPSPTVSGNKTEDGKGSGIFTSTIDGLSPRTEYYVRAYAVNAKGIVYGEERKFTSEIGEIKLSTSEVTEITENQAKSGGNITDDGGLEITARGVCWGTEPSPTISGNKTEDGTGVGVFKSTISGLVGGTTYYVRAYATNSLGTTSYGEEITFKTDYNLLNLAPGTLGEAIAVFEMEEAVSLKLAGTIDQRDFQYMKKMNNLADIDLKHVTIAAYENHPANAIPANAFNIDGENNMKLHSIVLPDNITAIGNSAFMRCAVLAGSLSIPDGVTEIGTNAFRGCVGLDGKLTLSSNLTKIGIYAFFNCEALIDAIIIPAGVTEIGIGAFRYCSNISHYEINNPVPITFTENMLSTNKDIYVPVESVDAYKAADGWKDRVIIGL